MKSAGQKHKKTKVLAEKDFIKIEIVKELGLWQQIQSEGWGSLTNETCGRIGGLVNKRLKENRMKQNSNHRVSDS